MRRYISPCFALVLSCGGAPPPAAPAAQACRPPPALGAAVVSTPGKTPPSAPLSHLGATLHVANALLERTLASSVPEVVAEGRNVSADAAGRTTFEIKRGKPRVKVSDAGLSLSVKLDGDIRLCKPFGGVCIAYGSCRPEWIAEVFARSPWRLNAAPDVALNVEISKGCVLSPVKVDVTSELAKVTATEVAKIRKQLDKEVRRFHRSLQKQLRHPAALQSHGECLTFAPLELEFAVDDERDGYTVDVELTGTPTWSCDTPAPVSERARVVTREHLSPKTEFHVSTDVPLSALATEWQARVPNHPLSVTPHTRELLVEVAGWQGCASGWVVYRPTHDGAFSLTAVETSDPTLPDLLGPPAILARTSAGHNVRTQRFTQEVAEPITVKSDHLPHPLQLHPQPRLKSTHGVRVEDQSLVLETSFVGTSSAELAEVP